MDDALKKKIDAIPEWKILDSREVYDNPWIQVTHNEVVAPTGHEGIYGKVHFKHYAIGIIPVDTEWNTWLVGQRRFPIETFTWEIPEGGGPVGEDPLLAAKRELAEEVGLRAGNWQEIQRLFLSNSVSDELAIIYLATELEPIQSNPDRTEILEVRKLPFDEAFRMAWDGEMTDTMTVTGLLRIQRMREHGRIQV